MTQSGTTAKEALFFCGVAKQVGCRLELLRGGHLCRPKWRDCLRIRTSEREVEPRHGERQIPNDTELLDPAIPEASFPRTFQFHESIYSFFWFKPLSGSSLSQGLSPPNTANFCSHPCLLPFLVAYPDACCAALEHSIRDGGPGRIYHGYKSRKAQATSWKVHGLHIEGVAGRVVLLTQVELAES